MTRVRPTVFLDVRDPATHRALVRVCERAGWARSAAPIPLAAVVADQLPGPPPRRVDVLVVEPTPAASHVAVDAFAAGRVRAVVAASEPDTLPRALELARAGYGIVPRLVVEAADRLPALSPRLHRVLQHVLRGRTNAAISRSMAQSLSSTKRDVSTLLDLFDAPNRQVLVVTAMRLGIRPSHGAP
jgi:DNA-binding CsgD family transcriptional regulator